MEVAAVEADDAAIVIIHAMPARPEKIRLCPCPAPLKILACADELASTVPVGPCSRSLRSRRSAAGRSHDRRRLVELLELVQRVGEGFLDRHCAP